MRRDRLLLVLLLSAAAAFSARYVARSTFLEGGERWSMLLDDAMVSMRYARNLARGDGLVFNPGERVEGFSNPLWVGAMALVHLLPLPARLASLAVQALSALLLLLGAALLPALCRELPGAPARAAPLAVLLAAFHAPLLHWGLLGMEVAALAPLLVLAALLSARTLADGRFRASPHALLALGTLLRMDAAVPAALAALFLARERRGDRGKHLGWGLGLLAVALAAQTAARGLYYGDLLPNTYSLKLTGYPLLPRLLRGLETLGAYLLGDGAPLALLALVALLLRPSPAARLLGLLFLGQAAYSAWVGGDAWEYVTTCNRYLATAVPLLSALAAVGTAEAASRLSRGREALAAPLAAGVGVVALLLGNGVRGPSSLATWWDAPRPAALVHAEAVRRALAVRAVAPPGASVAVAWAGIIPYVADRPAVDLLGKTDPAIARLPMRERPFYPGHLKWDYARSIGALSPDVVAQLWDVPARWAYLRLELVPPEAYPWLAGRYVPAEVDGVRLLLRAGGRARLPGSSAPSPR